MPSDNSQKRFQLGHWFATLPVCNTFEYSKFVTVFARVVDDLMARTGDSPKVHIPMFYTYLVSHNVA
jgi:hypothetical protein